MKIADSASIKINFNLRDIEGKAQILSKILIIYGNL